MIRIIDHTYDDVTPSIFTATDYTLTEVDRCNGNRFSYMGRT